MSSEIDKNIIYDRFLVIEGWAFRGKALVEKGNLDKAKAAYNRIKKEMDELKVLLKVDDGT